MHPEPHDATRLDPEAALPSPELRERVVRACRQAMEARHAAARRRRQRWQWCMAAGAAALLLFNAVQEQQTNTRMAAIVASRARVAQAPLPAGAIRSFHARTTLLAALLRDPDAL